MVKRPFRPHVLPRSNLFIIFSTIHFSSSFMHIQIVLKRVKSLRQNLTLPTLSCQHSFFDLFWKNVETKSAAILLHSTIQPCDKAGKTGKVGKTFRNRLPLSVRGESSIFGLSSPAIGLFITVGNERECGPLSASSYRECTVRVAGIKYNSA